MVCSQRCDRAVKLHSAVSPITEHRQTETLTNVEKNTAIGLGMYHSLQRNTGFGLQVIPSHALTPRSRTGQIMYWNRINSVPQIRPKMMVLKNAPTKPSTVFLGDSLMSGVRPMVTPQMYAKQSLQITSDAGTQNQIMPSRMLFTMKWLEEVANSSVKPSTR